MLEYSTDLFDEARIAQMLSHFEVLLQGIVANPEQRLWELPLLQAAEFEQTVRGWNETRCDFGPVSVLHELFEAQVVRTPGAVALICGDEQLSYAELNRRANQLAHYLRRQGVGPEVVVGLCLERTKELVVGLLGILKAGAAYVPLDPAYPQQRLAYMLADSQAQLVLTQERLREELPLERTLALDEEWEAIAAESEANPQYEIEAEQLAYVLYTSGSTGQPKGVMLTHGNAVSLVQWAKNQFSAAELKLVLAGTSICFDLSVFELWAPLSSGGAVVLVENALALPHVNEEVTLVNTVPSVMAELLRGEYQLPESVLTVNLAGEALSTALVATVYEAGRVQQVNDLYGPTEATTYSTWGRREVSGRATIGHPISNTEVYILDSWQQPVATGVRGEIYIGGAGLGRGYWQRAELTAERFVPHPYSARGGERLYRTGDEGRYLEDGRIEYLGRRDHQVKLRGFRIELGEIEAALESHAVVAQAAVQVREEQLVAYLVGESTFGSEREVAAELRPYLRERLPEYMVPQRWVMLDQMPLNTSGKIDRKQLPVPAAERGFELDQEETTPVEEMVAGIWSEVLKLGAVSRDENFFELGGHSLLATQVISRVRQMFGVEVTLRQLFEAPTVRGFSGSIEEQLRTGAGMAVPPLRRLGTEEREHWAGLLPLSFAQQRLWFLDQLEPGSASYNMPTAVRLKGELNVTALEQTLNEMVRRHEVLRTRFVNVEGEPRQQVFEAEDVKLGIIDLSGFSEPEREAAILEATTHEHRQPFDLAHDLMLRVKLLRVSDDDHVMVLTIHHIASDGWSMGVLIKEVATLYEAFSKGGESPLPELPIQFGDFAVWQRGWLQDEQLERQLAYWREQLGGELPVLELPTDRPRPAVQSDRGARLGIQLPAELSAGLKELSRREGVTLFMTLLAAFQTLLHRYSGQKEIVVGSPVAGRNYAETEGLIGFFVNTLVLRSDLSQEPTFVELLRQVKQVCLGAYAHQDVPFEKLIEELQPERDLSRSPLFQAMFILQNVPQQQQELQLSGLKLGRVGGENSTAIFDLTLALQEKGDELKGALEYRTDLFDEPRIERMLRHFETLLQGIVSNPEQRLWELPLLDTGELETLSDWNETVRDFGPVTPVHQLFEAQVERTPEAVAVGWGAEQLSYGELNQRANHLAHHLRTMGVGPEVLVGLCVERSVELLVGLLGILKAGGAYVPLDPGFPAARLNFMVKDAGVRVLLGTSASVASVTEHSAHLLCLDDHAVAIDVESDGNLKVPLTSSNLAYVIYTSGSTGIPKGVMVTHGALNSFLNSMARQPGLTDKDVLLAVTTFSFDIAALELFLPLIAGGKVLLVDREVATDGMSLSRELATSGATVMQATPSTWRMLVEAGWQGNEQLKVLCGGEALPPELAEQLRQRCGELWQMYGPTETTIWSVCGQLDSVNGVVPLGRAIANTQVYVVDEHLQQLPVGVAGDLLIGGEGLARGYYNRPELTAEKFIADPFGGAPGGRLYVTGDRARYLPDGQLQFLAAPISRSRCVAIGLS